MIIRDLNFKTRGRLRGWLKAIAWPAGGAQSPAGEADGLRAPTGGAVGIDGGEKEDSKNV